jgi:tRNA threonylcarbamoyladenosine biosynthesis protein TsaB
MAYILNIETSTKNCSVSVFADHELLASCELATDGYAHAEKLHVFIGKALKSAGITYNNLCAVAVSKGPGSYTGLRIGVSAAKGLCMALDIPLIGVNTLELLAIQLDFKEGFAIPMIDARRMEVYSQIFDTQYNTIRDVQAEIITADTYADLDGPIHIIGDCQPKIKTLLTNSKFVYHDNIVYPSAKNMGFISSEKFDVGAFEDLAYFEPFYLKDFMTKPL